MAGQLHLGRDRAFRNYFLLECLPCLLVENPIGADHVGECSEPTPVADCVSFTFLFAFAWSHITCFPLTTFINAVPIELTLSRI